MFETAMFGELVEKFCKACYENSEKHGFWDGPDGQSVPTKIALMHSELSELLEGFRSGNPPCPKPITIIDPLYRTEHDPIGGRVITSMEEEVADLFIRLCDFCGRYGIDLARVALAKHRYNVDRPYKHGKVC